MTVLKDSQQYRGQMLGTNKQDETELVRVTKDGYSIVDTLDNAGRNSFNDVFGGSLVVNRYQEVSINFSQGLETRAALDKSTNLGEYRQVDSKISIESGAAANSAGIVESKQGLRYRAGKSFEALFTARFSAPEVGNTRAMGLFDDNTGIAIRLIDDVLNFSLKRDGNWIINIPQSEWNADKLDGTGNSGFNLDISNLAIYRISGAYLGVAPLTLEVFAGWKNGFVEAHTMDFSNNRVDTHFNYPYLSVRGESINTTATGNNIVQSGSASAAIFDGGGNSFDPDPSSREFTVESLIANITGGIENVIGVFHSKDIFNGIENKIVSRLLSLSATSDGTKTVRFRVKRLLTPPTGGTWVDVDTNDSILEKSTDATVSAGQLADADLMFTLPLGKVDAQREYIANLNIRLFPNEYAVLTAESSNASEVSITIRESERF